MDTIAAMAGTSWLRTRLCIHMGLTAGVIGAWTPMLATYLKTLGFTPLQITLTIGTLALANILSSLLAGQIADRWMPTERLLAIINAVAGVFLLLAYFQRTFWPLAGSLLVAAAFFVPSFPLGASLSFHHLPDPVRQFPGVRVWGTIGYVVGIWIVTGWLHLRGPGEHLRDILVVAAVFAFANGAYSLLLPHTPTRRDVSARSAVGKALSMARDPGFVFFIAALFVFQLFSTFFFPYAGMFLPTLGIDPRNVGSYLSIGQITEVGMIFALPAIYARFGARATIAAGIGLWAVRYGIFAIGAPAWLVIASHALHGPAFAFSRIAATIYVDRIAERDVRASAQSFLSMTIDGAGPFLGAFLSGGLLDHFMKTGDWRGAWLVPAIGTAVVTVAFAVGFRPRVPSNSPNLQA